MRCLPHPAGGPEKKIYQPTKKTKHISKQASKQPKAAEKETHKTTVTSCLAQPASGHGQKTKPQLRAVLLSQPVVTGRKQSHSYELSCSASQWPRAENKATVTSCLALPAGGHGQKRKPQLRAVLLCQPVATGRKENHSYELSCSASRWPRAEKKTTVTSCLALPAGGHGQKRK